MTQEEREAANAALALDELIEKRVWEIIEKDQWRFDQKVIDAVVRGTWDSRLTQSIVDIIKQKL